MEKNNQNLLQKLTQILNVDKIISPDDVLAIRDALIGVLANNKKELESLTDETKQAVNSILDKVLTEHDTYLEKTKQIAQEAKAETTEAINSTLKSLEEVKALCKEVMECKPENGEDADEEYVIGEVLNRIKLPEYKEIVLDDGGAIVDKINSLPVNEENQIDAKHIKNLPEGKGGRVISGGVTRKIVEQMIEAAGAGGTPGGSTTQLQYNNAGAFGGISGATTDGTAVTFATDGLLANTLKSATSAGTLFESNSGTDVLLLGAGGGAGATFYGGVNVGGTLTVLGQGGTGGMVAGDASIGAGYTGISLSGTLTSSNYNFGGGTGDVNLYVNRPTGGKIFFRENNAAARVTFSASGLNGFETTSPTHTLTLASTSTGIALYNTADQTTNYERGQIFWNSNAFTISSTKAGSGTDRSLILSAGTSNQSTITLTRASLPVINLNSGVTSLTGNLSSFTLAGNATSGTQVFTAFTPTLTQTGTAGYTALLVNPTETTTGSGSKLLADFQVGGVSKTFINNTGLIGTTFAGTQLNFQTSSYIISSTNGSTFFQTGFSGKTFEIKDSGAVTRVSFAHDTGIMTNPQIINTPATITVTSNAGTVTRANRINNFTNSSAAAMTITMSTTSAADGDSVIVRIKDFSAAAQTITWVNTENSTVTAPTTSNGSTTLPLTVGFMYNSATSKWRCIASA